MIRLAPIFAFIFIAVQSHSSGIQQEFQELTQQAEAARKSDQTKQSIDFYRRAVAQQPTWSQGWWWLGYLYYQQDRFPEAEAALAQFVALEPRSGPAWALLGLSEYETHDTKQAQEHLDKWERDGSSDREYLLDVVDFHRALLMTARGEFEQASNLLQDSARRKGESPVLIEAFGLASLHIPRLPEQYASEYREPVWLAGKAAFYTALCNDARAQEYLSRLLKAYGTRPDVHYFAGLIFKAQSRNSEALLEFREELRLSGNHLSAALEAVQLDLDAKNIAEATSFAKHATQIEPENVGARLAYGDALIADGRFREGVVQLKAAERLDPAKADVHRKLAEAYRHLGMRTDADREAAVRSNTEQKYVPALRPCGAGGTR